MAYGLSTALSGADCYLGRLDELKKDGISHLELGLRRITAGRQRFMRVRWPRSKQPGSRCFPCISHLG